MALSPEVAYLCEDPELGAQPFTVKRMTGIWSNGRLIDPGDGDKTFSGIGIIVPPDKEQLEFYPEGEKTNNKIAVYTRKEIRVTRDSRTSDRIIWRGEEYKTVNVQRFDDWGFCVTFAVKG